jgi:hypothetical protein
MLIPITGLPPNVIGFEARGEIHADDYKTVLVPAIDGLLAKGDDIRVVLVFEEWDGLSGGAAWQDMRMGVEHLTHWKKLALVTDLEWMRHLAQLFGWMTPGELEHFTLAERDAAVAWAAS